MYINNIVEDWKEESGFIGTVLLRLRKKGRKFALSIYTSGVGWLIGYKGNLYNKYKKLLKERDVKTVRLVEVFELHRKEIKQWKNLK